MIHRVCRIGASLLCCGMLAALASCASGRAEAGPMAAARQAGWGQFGDSAARGGEVIALGALAGGEQDIVVEGTIVEVCQQKGCWMRVSDDDHELFVRFRDYGFFVPRDAAGRRVVMHGVAAAEIVPVDELRHYAEDAGKSPAEIAAITEPQMRITFDADSVLIEGAAARVDGPAATQPAR